MAHSAEPTCGRCGAWFEPSRGGWSQGHHVLARYPGLRAGAQEGDPMHDACYQAIYRLMVSEFRHVLRRLFTLCLFVCQKPKAGKRMRAASPVNHTPTAALGTQEV